LQTKASIIPVQGKGEGAGAELLDLQPVKKYISSDIIAFFYNGVTIIYIKAPIRQAKYRIFHFRQKNCSKSNIFHGSKYYVE